MFKILCLLILIFVSTPNIASAGSALNTKQAVEAMEKMSFAEPPQDIDINGLKISFKSPISDIGDGIVDADKYYAYKYHPDKPSVSYIGVSGVTINFSNETSNLVVISWKDSIISINGVSYGTPLINNTPYRDAGNPSATPTTIIPPGNSTLISAVLPNMTYNDISESWRLHPAPIPRNAKITFSLYLYITINGKTSYVTINSPGVYIPESTAKN